MAIPLSYSLRSLTVRKRATAMAVLGLALVVVVFNVLLAMSAGFRRAMTASGSRQNIIVLRKGAEAELGSQVSRDEGRIIQDAPFVAETAGGARAFVYENVILVSRRKQDGGETNVALRGTSALAAAVRPEVRVTAGRWFTPGAAEVMIGVGLSRRLEGATVGATLSAGQREWLVVGVFEAQGSALESEVWMDLDLMQSFFRRRTTVSTLLFRAAGDPEAAKETLRNWIDHDPRLRTLMVQTEQEYYVKQSKLMSQIIQALGYFLTGIMSLGAIVGAMNTMYAAVSQRKREIGCLLAIGFTPGAIWRAFIFEALLLGLCGAVLGCAISLLFNGLQTGTTNWNTFAETAFEFRLTPEILVQASVLALLMGFMGGLPPAWRASHLRVVEALKRQ